MARSVRNRSFFVVALVVGECVWVAMGQGVVSRVVSAQDRIMGRSQIVGPIDETQVVTLIGNVHPLAREEFDLGLVDAETRLDKMVLELEPSAEQQAELDALLEAQHDAGSPLFHQWLTPAEYGARFGVSVQDMTRIAGWLTGHGFTVDEIAASNRLIVFSGTAGDVEDTFHTAIHRYQVSGVEHIGNAQDPQIPAALAGVVGGVVSLHDFRRSSEITARRAVGAPASLGAQPEYSSGGTHYLFPADFATIYDLNPLYGAGTTGAGTSIAIVGRSNINVSDVAAFRTTAGLAANNPTVIVPGTNPGPVSGDQDEATLDVEWSGAVAPGATVKFVVEASTATTDGVDLSAQYIVNHATAPVVSTSYGSCEQYMGTTELAFYNSLWEQAASQGMSAFVASGDAGAAGCNAASDSAGEGTAVNGLCSSPYATCVGGTEFNEGSNPATYWATTNAAGDESALSYIPEEVWNESGKNGGSGLWASGGGVSTVYSEPSWQKEVSTAGGGMRGVPDVAMSAALHDGYVINENGSFWIVAGTSAASPSFAGVMALVVESHSGTGQGNANAGLYPLVNATHNPFHATPSGNNSVPGVTGFTASGGTYNLATGLGSVDGAVLASSWVGGSGGSGNSGPDFALAASTASGTVQAGKSVTFTVSVTESGSAKNAVALTAKAPAGVSVGFTPASIVPGTASTVTVTAGTTVGAQSITVTGSDASGTQSMTYALTVTQPPAPGITLAASTASVSVPSLSAVALTVTATPVGGWMPASESASPVTGLPRGFTATWSKASVSASGTVTWTLTLMGSATAAAGTSSLNLAVQVTAKTGAAYSASTSVSMTVTQSPPALTVATATTAVVMARDAKGTEAVTVEGNAIYSGAVTLSVSGLPAGVTAAWSKNPLTLSGEVGTSTLTLTAGGTAAVGPSTLSIKAAGDGVSATRLIVLQVQQMATTKHALQFAL